jgi:hypothetical protein
MTTTIDDLLPSERRRQRLIAEIKAVTTNIERIQQLISAEVKSPYLPALVSADLGEAYQKNARLLARLSTDAELTTY